MLFSKGVFVLCFLSQQVNFLVNLGLMCSWFVSIYEFVINCWCLGFIL